MSHSKAGSLKKCSKEGEAFYLSLATASEWLIAQLHPEH